MGSSYTHHNDRDSDRYNHHNDHGNHPVSYPHPERVGHADKAEKKKNPEVEIVIFTKKDRDHNIVQDGQHYLD